MFTVQIAGSVARFVRGKGWTISDAMMERLLTEQTKTDANDAQALSVARASYGGQVKTDTLRVHENEDCVDPTFTAEDDKPETVAKQKAAHDAYERKMAERSASLNKEAQLLIDKAAVIGASNAPIVPEKNNDPTSTA